MSRENVELVERFEELMLAHEAALEPDGDYREVLELLHPEVVVRVCASLPHGGEWVGHEGFVAMANAVVARRRVIDVPEFTYLDPGDEHVVVVITFMSEALRSGQSVPIRMVEIFTVRDGKIASLDPYYEDTVPFVSADRDATTV